MAAPPLPLLWAKLEPPRLGADVVERPHLIERLAADGAALTAIVAPAGYGKTTAAAQLAGRLGGTVAWLSLDAADHDPVRFWTYLAAAVGTAGVAGTEAVYPALSSGVDGTADASLLLRTAIETHAEPTTIILDDVHTIADDVIDHALGPWLRHPLSNLRIVCTSRRYLSLPVGRLRGQGLLAEAGVADLTFDDDESAALLEQTFGLGPLSPPQRRALNDRTRGWPVGLYLAGLTLRHEPEIAESIERFSGDTRHLSEYLAAEAMDGLSDDARAFLLATSILPVLDPDLCDAVTSGVGSLRILRRLVADNVFTVALDDGATVFAYHPLFREHLRSSLTEHHPEQLPELHGRASAWYERVGEIDRAVEHATAAGAIDRAEDLIGSQLAAYGAAGHFGTIIGWIDALGPATERSSETALSMAWVALNLRRYDELERWLAIAAANVADDADRVSVAVQAPTIVAHRARHLGDVGEQLRASAEAVAAYDRVDERLVPELQFGEATGAAARSAAAAAAYWAGDAESSRHHLMVALSLGRARGVVLELVFCHQYLALIEADAGDTEAALAHADQALSFGGPGREPFHLPTLAHLARSIALAGDGRPADAADALDAARRVAAHRTEPLTDAAIELQAARLRHTAGDQDGARQALRTAKATVAELPDPRFDDRIRAATNAIRFVRPDTAALPVGARELTDRELAVLRLLPHGLSRRELARQLHVSENTIKSHLTSIRHKLAISGRASIVERATVLGLLESDAT